MSKEKKIKKDSKDKSSKSSKKETEETVPYTKLFKYANGTEKLMIFIGVLCSVLQGCIMPLILGEITNVFVSLVVNLTLKKITGIQDHKDIFHDLYKQMIFLLIVGIVSFITTYLYNAFFNVSAYRQATKIRSLAFQSILKQEIAWHEQTSPGELSSRIVSDAIFIEDGMGVKLGTVLQSFSQIIACYAFAFKNGWKLTLEMSAVLPFILAVAGIMSYFLSKYSKKCQDIYAEMGGVAQEAFTQIRTIASFGNEDKEYKRYVDKLEPSRKYGVIKAHSAGISIGIIMALIYSSYYIAFSQGAKFIFRGEMNAGDVLKVFMNVILGTNGITNSGNNMNAIGEATGAASKLFSIIERKPKIDNNKGITPEKPSEGVIEFKDVHFRYPSRQDVEVLKGISFSCQPGKTIALVGASGSGKSTIIQLLERFYVKESGQILIDGKEIEEYNIHWLHKQIGLVSQEPNLFAATIAENISIAYPEATQEQIEEAAKLANAHDFISKLPNGYQTHTGERGLQLSGGQKQRICIARALMTNPKILLLDEATSALDNQSEKVVQKALDAASDGRTTIVIAHRLTTVKNADCIIVMNKGSIAEFGTHEELMTKKKVYYNLVKNQEMNIMNELEDAKENYNPPSSEEEGQTMININSPEEVNLTTKNLTRNSSISTINSQRITNNVDNKNKKKKSTTTNTHMNWSRFFQYNKSVWFSNIIGMIGSIFNGITQTAYALIFANAMNMFTKQNDNLLEVGQKWGLMFIALGILSFVSFYAQVGGFSSAGEFLSLTFRKLMYNSLIRQEVGFFDTSDIGDGSEQSAGGIVDDSKNINTGTLTAKLATEASLVQGLNISIGYILEVFFGVICGVGVALYFSWKLTLCLLLLSPLIFLGMYIQTKSLQKKEEELRRVYESSSSIACDAITSIKTVYALNLEDRFNNLYQCKLTEPRKSMERKMFLSSTGPALSSTVNFITYALGFYLGAIFIDKGLATFDDLVKVLMAVILTASIAGRGSAIAPNYTRAIGAFNHVIAIIDRKPKINSRDTNGIINENPEDFKGSIKFDGLRFRYPSRPNIVVLRMGNDSIDIPAGKMCAIVGGSGCGKSTILGLLPRWYDAYRGTITVDGVENKLYNIKYLREQIGFVSQEPSLFNITIKENIRYGKEDATDEEIYEAAKKANIHEFILSLPEGYNTVVGGIGTSKMSGGQKQRIAIARAIIRNPKILLLDEATSALDAESEIKVQKALEDASVGRTTITIAHRLSTVKNADLIVVMKNGRIIEKGTHEELMNLKKEYYEMVLAGDDGFSN
ncbi:multidrug resistance protein 1 [Anaeromyces robustus]|uniref:Multidrug resistance protein 1 n=1 Tax=Anaeromyces robustus TaxID=1754192 RepID=A0A1Y1XI69_9FUNG|nr:multidrug resistance protein 1 [Anaeromyces robustus]|eukprot:ORX85459.1 multidrug resistance protein 1 [Anaeromyces robustus]